MFYGQNRSLTNVFPNINEFEICISTAESQQTYHQKKIKTIDYTDSINIFILCINSKLRFFLDIIDLSLVDCTQSK